MSDQTITPEPTTPTPDLRWQCVCVDSTDPGAVATFWQQALGWRRTHETDSEVVLEPPAGSPEDGVGQRDVSWVVMADPEGNEFCVLRELPAD